MRENLSGPPASDSTYSPRRFKKRVENDTNWTAVYYSPHSVADTNDWQSHAESHLTLNLLTATIDAPPSNASKWQMGFNSAFKGLISQIPTNPLKLPTAKFV